jgi:cytochrome c oxidase cbb3-type subunit 3
MLRLRIKNTSGRHLIAGAVIALALIITGSALFFSHTKTLQSQLLTTNPDSIASDTVLHDYAMHHGRTVYADKCSTCHGNTLQGDSTRGAPNLADKDWLYGTGRVGEIERTLLYGIRSGHPKAWDLASMPGFARANPYKVYKIEPLTPRELQDVTEYVYAFQHSPTDPEAVQRGSIVFHKNGLCFDCHSEDARGDSAIGAPDLTDKIYLYGDGSRDSTRASIAHGLAGDCPAWVNQLAAADIRALAVYINSFQMVATHE